MKIILVALALWATIGCVSYRELQQIDMIQVHVIRIDTVWRHPDRIKVVTWKGSDDVEYVSYVSLSNEAYPIGTNMFVMKKR